ncbi:GbsR/MarR family transcriptional regulator [Actinomadura rugatobispora]|uniref:GbsR/MarR family transcriptional regulator n=1 Tax=Actinomadura rugatobispora TaxID=1994 RepID=A0ABW0ZLT7_9ACTN
MPSDAELIFADHVGRFYARQYGFPPMAGRLLGYLFVCDPPQQTIDELAEALLASRSAITGAVKLLEGYRMARRTRAAGERMDRVSVDPATQQPQNFESAIHREHAALFREGLALLAHAPPERRAPLEEMVALAEFLSERLPALAAEWHAHRDELRATGRLPVATAASRRSGAADQSKGEHPS